MTPRAPRLEGREVIRALERHGFQIARIRGSHRLMRHADGRTTVVPVHRGETIGQGLLAKVLRDVRLTVDDLAG